MLTQIISNTEVLFVVYKYKQRRNQSDVTNNFHLQENLKSVIAC